MRSVNFFFDKITRFIRVRHLCLFLCVVNAQESLSQTAPSQRLKPHLKNHLGSPYGFWEYLPADYHSSNEKFPLVLYLHGIKEIGNGKTLSDLNRIIENGVPYVIKRFERDFPFVLIAPQSPGEKEGFPAEQLDKLIEIVKANYNVDEDRIYVTGLSFGAYATLRLASHIPHKIAAIVPISSCGAEYDLNKLKDVPLWAFGNAGDKPEIPACIHALTDSIREHGGTPLLTLYPHKGHNAWTRTYKRDYMWDWLLKQRRSLTDENQSPILINPGNQTVGIGAKAHFHIMASDRNNDVLKFSLKETLPKGSQFIVHKNGDADLFLNTLVPGTYNISVSVSDGKGGVSTESFYMTSSYQDLLLPYILLLSFLPFVLDLPLVSLPILLLITEYALSNLFHFIVHFMFWVIILMLIQH